MANKTIPATTVVPSNAEGSNKSTPAPKVAVPAGIKKWLWLMVVAVAIIVGIALLVASVKRDRAKVAQAIPQYQQQTATIPLASSPQSSWPKLVIPANGKSELIPVPVDMHILMAGNNFLNHNVYIDGHECVFGEPCVSGPLAGNYATNEASEKNIVSYAFAPN